MGNLKKPAIKQGMRDLVYYMSSMTFEQLAQYVQMPEDVCKDEVFVQKLQANSTSNTSGIFAYLQNKKDIFLSALVIAVLDGKPVWYPGVFEKDEESFYDIGLLEFSGEEKLFPINEYDKLVSIKKIVESGNYNEDEEIPVIFVSYQLLNEVLL